MVAMDFFAASNSYDFFNQYCSNLLKNPTVGGLTPLNIHYGLKTKQTKPDHTPQFIIVVVVNSCIYLTIVSYFQRCFNSLTLMTKALINAAGILSL